MDLVARIIMSVRYIEVTVRVTVRRDLLRVLANGSEFHVNGSLVS